MKNKNKSTTNAVPAKESADKRLIHIQSYLEEAGLTIDYLRWRVLSERGIESPASPLFKLTADMDGKFSEEQIVEQLEAIARQARAGFCSGEEFPVFGPLDREAADAKK